MLMSGAGSCGTALNESPSEKEGKFSGLRLMGACSTTLNESPSEKEGKFIVPDGTGWGNRPLNESPSEKEGKSLPVRGERPSLPPQPSMKVPPKRKGNLATASLPRTSFHVPQ